MTVIAGMELQQAIASHKYRKGKDNKVKQLRENVPKMQTEKL